MSATHVGRAWSCTVRLVVEDDRVLDAAAADLHTLLDRVDDAASRFRADSALSRANARAGRPIPISLLLVELVDAALRMAAHTDGAVDPTLGRALSGDSATTATSARSLPTGRRSRRALPPRLARRPARPRDRAARPCRAGPRSTSARRRRRTPPTSPRRRSHTDTGRPCWSSSAATSPSPATARTGGCCRSPSARAATVSSCCPRRRPDHVHDHGAPLAARRPARPPHRRPAHRTFRPTARGAPRPSLRPTRCTRTPRAPRRSCWATDAVDWLEAHGYAARLVAHDGTVQPPRAGRRRALTSEVAR